ncbi:MAG: tRNA (N6-isopentenyl adenosine(37)-C2)-methylthiotransferase MiaB [Candidatus Zixiibacteriota bacterium]|nr:MAG: tRNA (N6-isopentenyl adenosine(37)-C2)-methylthiotransferase MiaB [candidate division Zixibacteria bacterium]
MKVKNNTASKPVRRERLRFYIETYGCQMNEYDSELVRSILLENRFDETAAPDQADVILLNTCSVRESAHNRVFGRLQSLDKLRAKSGKVAVGVLGCMAQSLKMELLENSIYVDLIAGPDSYRCLPEMIRESLYGSEKVSAIDLSEFETYDDIYPARLEGVNAWIAVMRGCDNFCTFCIVPYARGRERSRSVESVADETRRLVEEAYTQVTLLGQNVNSYSHEGRFFADLMNTVSKVEGLKRIRFTSPHPKDFPDDLIDCVAMNSKVCKHIHLPLQAGSDRILKMMNRDYTADGYVRLVERIRDCIPDLVLTTDIILGFPSETREEYEETVNIVEEVGFDSAFIFNYSERKGTVAARRWEDDVPPEEKKYRIIRLNEIQKGINIERNRKHIGRVLEILVEGPSKRDPNEWFGRTDGNKMAVFPRTDQKAGDYVRIEITGATANTLKGKSV